VRIKRRSVAAIIAVVALAAGMTVAATTATAGSSRGAHYGAAGAHKASAGGVYSVEWEASFDFTGGFDPTGEYLGAAIGIYSNLLVRTLVGYNHVVGAPGNVLVPDLATNLGTVSKNGLTYTFHLKNGIKFGPPLNREITSKDILYSMERIGTPALVAQYGFYYNVIKGMTAFESGKSKVISGIQTPDPKTIIFHLTVPTGDFRYRLGMPAAGPIPQEVAGCFNAPNLYGRYLISSGPYMFAGSDKLDATSCATITAAGGISGFDGTTKMDLVRNPDYNPSSDSPKARENLPDEFTFTINSNPDDIFARIGRGEVDDDVSSGGPPPTVLRQYHGSKQLHIDSGDRTWYLNMNMTQPPFDDIHIRKAMNWIVNKDALRKAWGGADAGLLATHIAPDNQLGDLLKGYAPYGVGGNLAKAKAEIKLSKYDSNHDGICDAKACKNVFTITGDRAVEKGFIPVLEQELGSIGITLKDRVLKDAYTPIGTVAQNVPFSTRPGWGKDYSDPYAFFGANFDGRAITPTGNANRGLVGLTAAQAKTLKVKGNTKDVPSVNADLDKCQQTVGKARLTCYAALDKTLMTKVVPWVPYLWASYANLTSTNVTQWNFDQFSAVTAFAHVAVK
jgi:peptide/nickel transport system substrate-binding protein